MSFLNPPDPSQISAQAISTGKTIGKEQTAANQAAQRGSMVNQSNPWGGVSWMQTGTGPNGVPIYGANVDPSGAAAPSWANMFAGKALAGGQANQMLQNADYAHNDPMSTIGNMSSGLAGQRMNSWLGSQMPFFNQSRDRLDTQLKNQGFTPGQPGQEGSAYNNSMMGLDRDQGLAVGQAASQFANDAWNQGAQAYQMPLTMGEQLSQWGAPQDPTKSFVQAPGLQPADYTSASAIGAKTAGDVFNAQSSQYGGMLSGLSQGAGAGLSLAMLSDERVKENKDEVGSLHDGTPVYSYNYIGDPMPRIGLMAQDVEKTRPDAVHDIGGIKAVDYDKATARSRAMKALLG